jgi:hypothetical protein
MKPWRRLNLKLQLDHNGTYQLEDEQEKITAYVDPKIKLRA